jgi:sortase (surface protein transpeptidase)
MGRMLVGRYLRRDRYKPVAVLAVLVLAVLSVLQMGLISWPQPEPSGVVFSTEEPAEDTVAENKYEYHPVGKQPERLVMPSIQVEALIQRVSVDQRGEVAVPTNVTLAGWFTKSVPPGEKGLSIIDGHLNGRTRDGIFKNLSRISPGETFSVVRANRDELQFRVMKVLEVPAAEAANQLFSQDPKVERQLNLITCAGTFDEASSQFDKRVIVTAELVESKK